MKTFNYSPVILSAVKCNINSLFFSVGIDVLAAAMIYMMIREMGYSLSVLRLDGDLFFSLILVLDVVFFIFSLIDLLREIAIASNLQREKLVLTDTGLKISYHEDIASKETFRYIEVPWEEVKKADIIVNEMPKTKSIFGQFSFMHIFKSATVKVDYKDLSIYTTRGLFKVSIDNPSEAATLITDGIQHPNSREYYKSQKSQGPAWPF